MGVSGLCSKLERLLQHQTVHAQFNVLELMDLRLLRLLQRQFAHGGGAGAGNARSSTTTAQVRRLWRHWLHVAALTGASAVQPNAARLDRVFFEILGFLCRLLVTLPMPLLLPCTRGGGGATSLCFLLDLHATSPAARVCPMEPLFPR